MRVIRGRIVVDAVYLEDVSDVGHGRVGNVSAVLIPPNPPPRMTMCGSFT